ncbi:unnamed protein product [Eruca vesicaria subsp. sativa]|uniref:Uncharacterized protein n=1 Tax=Eruca vesicaria subsp. sativa TaxID=29727 RepID=A0ABC8IM05_ERUVS|nr:unnamed protein product [Eruca vesicaria subsp. sativa]
MSIIMRNLLIIILIFCVNLNWVCTEGAQERESGKVDYHTVQLSSSTVCCSGSNTKGSLHVVDKHVVRSPLRRSKVTRLDLDNIVRHDRARLDYIHSRLSNNFADRPRQTESKDIPVKDVSKSKSKLGCGSYIETIGNGNT